MKCELALVLVGLTLACGGGSGAPDLQGTISGLQGGGQAAPVTSSLTPYQVGVLDDAGAPKPGVTVVWTVSGGGGTVAPATSITDAAGVAEAAATLGTTAGAQSVRASASGYAGSPISFTSTGLAGPAAQLAKSAGDNQNGAKAAALPLPLVVLVSDQYGNPVSGETVTWAVTAGGGSVSAPTSITGSAGTASVSWTLGGNIGPGTVTAGIAAGPTASFTGTARTGFAVLGGGNNVPERFGADLWVADGYGYSGSWGTRFRQGNAVKIWRLGPSGAPAPADSIITPSIGTVSDVEVSPDGKWLVFTAEGGSGPGLYVYELTSPGTPVFRAKVVVSAGLHTGALSVIGGKLYAFTARDPVSPALVVYDLSDAINGNIPSVSTVPIPANYGIHDTFVRDGYAFVFAWNEGLYIFDVGNGSHGGSPGNPVQISKTAGFGGETHNGWWFWNPTNGEKKYLFIGEEGPGSVGASSSGDIHVVDVSDLSAPVEVASYHLAGAGAHNFWMDEANQRLYAAFYNGGVVALDVSGTLSGSLASREIARIQPGGPGNTYTWGVMLYNGFLYASDMVSGFWQLGLP